jgi:hypothetical protein
MRVRHFNIAVVAWSNFKLFENTNGRMAIFFCIPTIDLVTVGASVQVAVVNLRTGRGERESKDGSERCREQEVKSLKWRVEVSGSRAAV